MRRDVFLIRFPEFKGVGASYIDAHIAAAANEIDPVIWRTKTDEGVIYLAAHKMASSPYGEQARLITAEGGTTYFLEFKRLVRLVSSGFRVA